MSCVKTVKCQVFKMDELQLSDTLHRYFSDVFLCYGEETSGTTTIPKTIDIIKSANIPDEIIAQISEICWGHQNTALLTKKQFFSALKLVAAHQANMPLKPELITTNITQLPLPRFTWSSEEEEVLLNQIPDLIELSEDIYPDDKVQDFIDSTDSEVESDTLSIVHNGSPEVSSTASDSPTPTNSVQDRSWAVGGPSWQGLVSEEQRQLLEESSDRHSSEDENTEVSPEIWIINSEQREYYTNQFRSLQPDLNALLAGSVARMFFEKSRLPVHELRKIWQLADVTKDGALSLQEFNTAMHLVVLRRNNIELPDILPVTLQPGCSTGSPLSISPDDTDSGGALLSSPQQQPNKDGPIKEWTKFIDSPTSSISSPGPKPVNFDFQKITLDNKDSSILHPVALRLTPECCANPEDDPSNINNNTGIINAIQRPQPKKKVIAGGPIIIPPPPSNTMTPTTSAAEEPIAKEEEQQQGGPVSLPNFTTKKEKPPPPPPRPIKSHGRSSSLDLDRLTKLGAPPTVPPRISPSTAQPGSSQGNNRKILINQRSEGGSTFHTTQCEKYENVDEGVFPGDLYEAERQKLFARFTTSSSSSSSSSNNNNNNNNAVGELPRKHGAFEVYRKPVVKDMASSSPPVITSEDRAKWELFQKLQEENTVLLRICQELSQELADVREEKMALKLKLEKQTKGGAESAATNRENLV